MRERERGGGGGRELSSFPPSGEKETERDR